LVSPADHRRAAIGELRRGLERLSAMDGAAGAAALRQPGRAVEHELSVSVLPHRRSSGRRQGAYGAGGAGGGGLLPRCRRQAGRVVCLASLVAVSVLAGLIVRRETSSRAAAVYAGLCLFAWLGAFNGQGRAMDDPEMLSAACATFGLYAYVNGRHFLWPSAAA